MKLNIFTDLEDLPPQIPYEPILLGSSIEKINTMTYYHSIFEEYLKRGSLFLQESSLEEADLVVLPINWEKALTANVEDLLIKLIKTAKEANTISISFFDGDCSHLRLEQESDIMFRHSLYASTRTQKDFAYPAWSQDMLSECLSGELPIRKEKPLKPTVGFCGFSTNNFLKDSIKILLHKTEKSFINRKIPRYHIGHVFRKLSLSLLSSSPLVYHNFIIRDESFFQKTKSDSALRKKQKYEFMQNMLNSDYTFCCRGSGNYSLRFYESLSCGRIPVFLNTDCVLPYDFEIDWKKYCVWIEENELPLIAEKVAEFHENLSPQEFVDLQYSCRKIWEKWISPEGFFANLYRHFSQL